MRLSKFLSGASLASLVLVISANAFATTIVAGSSSGSFSDLSSCYLYEDCKLTASNTEAEWGSAYGFPYNFNGASTLTAVGTSFSSSSIPTSVSLGELAWHNTSIAADPALRSLSVDWNLSINFTTPSLGAADTETFELTINNTSNPSPDTITDFTLADLNTLTTTLNTALNPHGVNVTGLEYDLGTSSNSDYLTCGSSKTKFATASAASCGSSNVTWTLAEGDADSLTLNATIGAASVVPEPMSLALLGSGLAGLGIARRRRHTT